ncbi:hypothetical protein C4E44_16825 [Pseudomonas sp. MWU12-2312b]|nr:hypothetical protein C4E44_16825 [Pseudomonas sp. MWU12-2312b]
MLFTGCLIVGFNILLRAALFPAEYSLAGHPSNYPRIFFSSLNRVAYRLIESGSRWGGSILIAGGWIGFEKSLSTLAMGGVVTVAISSFVAPMISMLIASKIHPGFRRTLSETNSFH